MASAPEPETDRRTGEPGATPWVGIALAVVLGAVALWAWDRVQLWTQIVLISLTGLAVVILLVAVTLRRGARRVPRVRDTTAASQWRAARLFLYAALGLAVIS